MKELLKTIVLQPQITASVVGFEVNGAYDDKVNKTVTANVNLVTDSGERIDRSGIVVWHGDAYDTAGQWTDTDLENQLFEILNQ